MNKQTKNEKIEAALKAAIQSGASEGKLIGMFLHDLLVDNEDMIALQGSLDEIMDWAQHLQSRLDEIERDTGHPHPDVRTYSLGYGYYLRPGDPLPDGRDVVDGKTGWCLDWTVTRSRDSNDEEGREIEASASLNFVQQMGMLHLRRSGMEEDIPRKVLDKMEQIVSKLESADLV
jgi:hypothetical protein